MSSVSSSVRRPAEPASNAASAAVRPASHGAANAATTSHGALDAADIPPLDTNLDIDGLKPSLFSRLLDLFARKR